MKVIQKTTLLFLFLVFALARPVSAQSSCATLDFGTKDIGNQVIRTSDGNFLFVGEGVVDGGDQNFNIAKVDNAGSILWAKSANGPVIQGLPSDDRANGVVETHDGTGYIVVGSSWNLSARDVGMLRLDLAGNLVWAKTVDFSNGDNVARKIIRTEDGNYAVVGSTTDQETKGEMLIFKIDDNGTVLNSAKLGGLDDDSGMNLIQLGNGNLVGIGTRLNSAGADKADIFVATVTSGLAFVNASVFTGIESDEFGVDLAVDGSGGIVLLANQTSSPATEILLVRVNSGGAIFARRFFEASGANLAAADLLRLGNGALLVAGSIGELSGAAAFTDGLLLRTNANGGLVGANRFGTAGNPEQFNSVLSLNSGATTLTGFSPGPIDQDFYVVKTNAAGTSCCSEPQQLQEEQPGIVRQNYGERRFAFPTDRSSLLLLDKGQANLLCSSTSKTAAASPESPEGRSFEVFPNPAQDRLSVRWQGDAGDAVTLQILDLRGSLLQESSASGLQTDLRLDELPNGLYLLRLSDGQDQQTAKFQIQR